MIDFGPTSTVELRPHTREMMGRFALSVDVLYTDLADVGKPILSFDHRPDVLGVVHEVPPTTGATPLTGTYDRL